MYFLKILQVLAKRKLFNHAINSLKKYKIKISAKTTDSDLEIGTVVVVNLIVNSGEQKLRFFGFVANIQKHTDGTVVFETIISRSYIDVIKTYSKVYIDAYSNVKCFVDTYCAIYEAFNSTRNSNGASKSIWINGIVDPAIFGKFEEKEPHNHWQVSCI